MRMRVYERVVRVHAQGAGTYITGIVRASTGLHILSAGTNSVGEDNSVWAGCVGHGSSLGLDGSGAGWCRGDGHLQVRFRVGCAAVVHVEERGWLRANDLHILVHPAWYLYTYLGTRKETLIRNPGGARARSKDEERAFLSSRSVRAHAGVEISV
jgi:hypothetical protein